MKKIVLFLIAISLLLLNVNAQQKEGATDPDEQIIVNKEFDENGNLIGFDSTYIHKWSSDTSFNFNFNDKLIFGDDFTDMNKFLEEFFGDSTHQNFGFPQFFGNSPFNNEEFFNSINPGFADSAFMKNFNFEIDSLNNFQHNFVFPDMKQLQEQFEQQFKNFDFQTLPNNKNLTEKQKKELEELQKKHQKEMEELRKKWEEKQK